LKRAKHSSDKHETLQLEKEKEKEKILIADIIYFEKSQI